MTRSLSPGRFARLLDTHGPRPERWPAAMRPAAAALLAGSPAARARLAEAQRLDAGLAAALPHPAPEAVARLRAAVAREIARTPLPAPATPWARLLDRLRPAAPAGWGALAALATCALWLGFSAAPAVGDPLAPLQTLPILEDPL
ncbi:hypothetical protein [Paracraurococcus lichenis]|uniref:DUF3619 family protein n=1 Tax=Paracraurococcus lichenis TaxID=3064888 RepID=A0ABT9DSE8_9PROT|nr:hypothetical protein [Paracraurococcus sp. LOR1-02]MDO9706813.1 hypothetical protein [Paracraurococcus sp. LOR1-02]